MLPEFVFLKSKGFNGVEYILCTVKPFAVFRVYWFRTAQDLDNFVTKNNLAPGQFVQVPGYRIGLFFVGFLGLADLLPLFDERLTPGLLTRLKAFYISERVTGHESRLKNFKQ